MGDWKGCISVGARDLLEGKDYNGSTRPRYSSFELGRGVYGVESGREQTCATNKLEGARFQNIMNIE